jgi:predicted nucleic acid-binding protein
MATDSPRVFLDANVLFSSALGGATFVELWAALALRGCEACTSPQCVEEARRNVVKKRPELLPRLEATLARVALTLPPVALVAGVVLPDDDAPVLAAAVECGARVLLTGNTRHFGPLMLREDLPLQVRTVRAWLDQPGG